MIRVSLLCLLIAAAVLTGYGVAGATAEAARSKGSRTTHIYVSPKGKDSWPGTFRKPFATLTRAQRKVRANVARMNGNIVVSLRGGTYRLTAPLALGPQDSGQNGHRVIYQPRRFGTPAQEAVVVSGGRRITGWKLADGPLGARGIWQAEVGDLDTRQLFVNGRRAMRTERGHGLPGIPGKGQAHLIADDGGYTLDSPEPQNWANPEDVEFLYDGAYPWAEGRCGVASIKAMGQSTRIDMDQPCWRYARANYTVFFLGMYYPVPDPTGIENSITFLRHRGTFYLDRSRPRRHVLSYIPRGGEDLRRAEVIAPAIETLVSAKGTPEQPVHHITFRGLTFSHATWLGPNDPVGFAQFFANWYANSDKVNPSATDWATNERLLTAPGHLLFHTAQWITLANNRFTKMGGVAVEFSHNNSDNVVRGNLFADLSGGGLEMGTLPPATVSTSDRNRVENNWVHDIGIEYPGTVGIMSQGGVGSVVRHNQVNDTPYGGILTLHPPGVGCPYSCQGNPDPMSGYRIEDNLVFDTMLRLGDGGGIYVAGSMGGSWEDGAIVSGNVVHDIYVPDQWTAMTPARVLYMDDGTDWITAERNVLYRGDAVYGGNPTHARLSKNFWDQAEGSWATVQAPETEVAADNTLLPKIDPAKACAAIPECAAIVTNAGLQPKYRRLLVLDDIAQAPRKRAPRRRAASKPRGRVLPLSPGAALFG
jgi:hypothetical protein